MTSFVDYTSLRVKEEIVADTLYTPALFVQIFTSGSINKTLDTVLRNFDLLEYQALLQGRTQIAHGI